MSKLKIINAQLRAGLWQAEIAGTAEQPPQISVQHEGVILDGVTLDYDAQRAHWRIAFPIPADAITDGVQTFVVCGEDHETLAHFSVLSGDSASKDLRAEIDLLRNELEVLKAAFRRHCAKDL